LVGQCSDTLRRYPGHELGEEETRYHFESYLNQGDTAPYKTILTNARYMQKQKKPNQNTQPAPDQTRPDQTRTNKPRQNDQRQTMPLRPRRTTASEAWAASGSDGLGEDRGREVDLEPRGGRRRRSDSRRRRRRSQDRGARGWKSRESRSREGANQARRKKKRLSSRHLTKRLELVGERRRRHRTSKGRWRRRRAKQRLVHLRAHQRCRREVEASPDLLRRPSRLGEVVLRRRNWRCW
jgi:hypothetical protein